MYKEAMALTILRYVMLTGIMFLLGMLYWSSLLTEEKLQAINKGIAELKNDERFSIQNQTGIPIEQERSKRFKRKSLADPLLTNLLTNDPFYEKTLPQLLGKDFRPFGSS